MLTHTLAKFVGKKRSSGVKRKDFLGPKPAKAEGGRVRAAGGGLMEATQKLRRQKGGGVCLRGMNREAIGKFIQWLKKVKDMVQATYRYWKSERWFPKCVQNRKRTRRGSIKMRALAKARRMSEGQRRSAVARKRAAANVGPKPTNVATFAKRKKMGFGGLV